jgi:hypothetical protein
VVRNERDVPHLHDVVGRDWRDDIVLRPHAGQRQAYKKRGVGNGCINLAMQGAWSVTVEPRSYELFASSRPGKIEECQRNSLSGYRQLPDSVSY